MMHSLACKNTQHNTRRLIDTTESLCVDVNVPVFMKKKKRQPNRVTPGLPTATAPTSTPSTQSAKQSDTALVANSFEPARDDMTGVLDLTQV